jgi:hypothetical protein
MAPADLAVMVFRHPGIPLDSQWTNPQGRPIPIVTEGGRLIPGVVVIDGAGWLDSRNVIPSFCS